MFSNLFCSLFLGCIISLIIILFRNAVSSEFHEHRYKLIDPHYVISVILFQEKSEQTRNASNSIVQNLEAKIVDLENRLRQPSAESAEDVRKLRTRLQESEKRLQEAEQQIDELETKKESWRQEVGDATTSFPLLAA